MKKVVIIGWEAGAHAIQIGIQAGLIQGAYQACPSVHCDWRTAYLRIDMG